MLILVIGLIIFKKCQSLSRVPDSILYHELVDYSSEELEHAHSRHRRELSSSLSFSFQAFDKLFRLRLSKNDDVFTKDVRFTSTSGDVPYDLYSLVKGIVNGDSSSSVHGSVHDGIFEGVITYDNETYQLEKAHKYYDNPAKHSLIYRLSDTFLDPETHKCGVKDSNGNYSSINDNKFNGTPDNKEKYFREKRETVEDERPIKYCTLYMGADFKFFSQHSNNFVPSIISKLGTYVQHVNDIYSNTHFLSYNYRIKFLINRIHVYETPNNKYDEKEYAVAKFLDLFSTQDDLLEPDDYCIAYMFTHRDFEDGVLGLAWVASSGTDSGGLCTRCRLYDKGINKSRCLNTGIVTTKNVKEVPAIQSYLTFGHELGHNLGSPHDPASCSPGGDNGGNFLMYPHANTGNHVNNEKLSTCSREIMGPIISIRSICFKSDQSVCGDFVKNKGEMCDCGDAKTCESDTCCAGQKTCVFRDDSYTCSKMDGVCCNTDNVGGTGACTPYAAEEAAKIVCAVATDCRENISCQAGTYECPVSDTTYNKEDKTLCSDNTQVCKEGICTGSLCVFAGTKSCQCLDTANKCNLCCEHEISAEVKECLVATDAEVFPQLIDYLSENTTAKLSPGSVCGGDMGYCDIFYVCRIVDADGPIASLGNYIFNGVLFDAAENIAKQYWYYCIMLSIGIVCFMVAFIAVCSKTVKPPKIPRGGERMNHPVGYKNINVGAERNFEMVSHR